MCKETCVKCQQIGNGTYIEEITEHQKRCSKCRVIKERTEFNLSHPTKSKALRGECKPCQKIKNKKAYDKRKAKAKAKAEAEAEA